MKKVFVFVIFAALVGFVNEVSAQEFRGSVGLELALPIGDFGDIANLGYGVSGAGELPITDNLAVTGTLGFVALSVDAAGIKSASMIPVQFGLKYYFNEMQSEFYGQAQVGVHSVRIKTESISVPFFGSIGGETTSETDLSYAAGVGYFVNENIDIALRYNGIASDPTSLSYIGVRAAYNF